MAKRKDSKDAVLNWAGGNLVTTKGTSDVPASKAAKQASGVMDSGEFGRAAAKFLGKAPAGVKR